MAIRLREPGSAITHFIAFVLAVLAAPFLIEKASSSTPAAAVGVTIFCCSLMVLYLASTVYHSVDGDSPRLVIFKKLDHLMIFILIAGSYTPVCLNLADKNIGKILLIVVWSISVVGMIIKAFWIYCPKWFSSAIYISLGWACAFIFKELLSEYPPEGFMWLLAGGLFYTVGGIIYALKLPIFNSKHKSFGSHEIFHLFVMAGSFCHFVFMYNYIA